MSKAYLCPNCKSNRTRFNIIEQHAKVVKLDSESGEVIHEYTSDNIEPFHMKYHGPKYKVQCGVCGLLEAEEMFTKFAQYSRNKEGV